MGIGMMAASQDLANRTPVWDALSELFLDTELQPEELERIGRTLATSPYSIEELDAILFDEVYPVCIWNLRTVAGEWAGFDSESLHTAILNHLRAWVRIPRWLQTGHWMIREPWTKVKDNFMRNRSDLYSEPSVPCD